MYPHAGHPLHDRPRPVEHGVPADVLIRERRHLHGRNNMHDVVCLVAVEYTRVATNRAVWKRRFLLLVPPVIHLRRDTALMRQQLAQIQSAPSRGIPDARISAVPAHVMHASLEWCTQHADVQVLSPSNACHSSKVAQGSMTLHGCSTGCYMGLYQHRC